MLDRAAAAKIGWVVIGILVCAAGAVMAEEPQLVLSGDHEWVAERAGSDKNCTLGAICLWSRAIVAITTPMRPRYSVDRPG